MGEGEDGRDGEMGEGEDRREEQMGEGQDGEEGQMVSSRHVLCCTLTPRPSSLQDPFFFQTPVVVRLVRHRHCLASAAFVPLTCPQQQHLPPYLLHYPFAFPSSPLLPTPLIQYVTTNSHHKAFPLTYQPFTISQ
ncbi:hypothetical protein Pcinc_033725 [Petrolisthes cinctipes]|uniref:Uncharacterized protein n=1 Tax=Petrolisthes cinctipes TaxID=88211 RepID=A0AAE1K0T3_PETCI|nr:hypothetical protein Pcinc_033725 [Petrolisthes cinctipes]